MRGTPGRRSPRRSRRGRARRLSPQGVAACRTQIPDLTGHLKEYPLSDVFGILRHQRKTGRLLIDYPASPCAFFFKDGELVDARMGAMEGLQAILLATNMPDSPFNFNPLIQPSEHSVNNSLRKLALGMIGGAWTTRRRRRALSSVGLLAAERHRLLTGEGYRCG